MYVYQDLRKDAREVPNRVAARPLPFAHGDHAHDFCPDSCVILVTP